MTSPARDWSREDQARVAADPTTPQWRLSELVDSDYAEVRLAVAGHPSASDLTLGRLANDPDPAVAAAARRRRALDDHPS